MWSTKHYDPWKMFPSIPIGAFRKLSSNSSIYVDDLESILQIHGFQFMLSLIDFYFSTSSTKFQNYKSL